MTTCLIQSLYFHPIKVKLVHFYCMYLITLTITLSFELSTADACGGILTI